jgi:hypothetical protein
MTITKEGNVGIGTTSPSNKLDIAGGLEVNAEAYIRSTSNVGLRIQTTDQGTTSADGLRVGLNSVHAFVWQYEALPLSFATSGVERIGTTSPGAKLNIDSVPNNEAAILANQVYARISLGPQGSSGDAHFGASGNGTPTVGSQDYGFYAAHNAYRSSTGAWKHSRTSTIPSVRLLGSGGVSSGNQGFSFDYSANVGTADITWTNLMKILPSGDVGIGTTSPGSKLDVSGGDIRLSTNATYLRSKDSASAIPRVLGMNASNAFYLCWRCYSLWSFIKCFLSRILWRRQ